MKHGGYGKVRLDKYKKSMKRKYKGAVNSAPLFLFFLASLFQDPPSYCSGKSVNYITTVLIDNSYSRQKSYLNYDKNRLFRRKTGRNGLFDRQKAVVNDL